MKRSNQVKVYGYQLHVDPVWEEELVKDGSNIHNTSTAWDLTIVKNEKEEK